MNEQNKIEKLMKQAGVSYDEAVSALEASDWDILNAIILLEKQNGRAESVRFSTKADEKCSCPFGSNSGFTAFDNGFYKWLCMVIKKGSENRIEIVRKGRTLLSLPFIIAIIILLVTIRETPIIIVVSLFFGCQYRIKSDIKLNEEKAETGEKFER